jgi:hypothetical protein
MRISQAPLPEALAALVARRITESKQPHYQPFSFASTARVVGTQGNLCLTPFATRGHIVRCAMGEGHAWNRRGGRLLGCPGSPSKIVACEKQSAIRHMLLVSQACLLNRWVAISIHKPTKLKFMHPHVTPLAQMTQGHHCMNQHNPHSSSL